MWRFTRRSVTALACALALAAVARADEYKGAVVKGVQKGKFVFEVDGQELSISPGSIAFRSFDQNGKPLTGFGENYRVMKAGNVVDLVTARKNNTEYVREIHLRQGELLEMGNARTTNRGSAAPSKRTRPALEQHTYKGATIQSVDQRNVVLVVGDRELPVMASGAMKAFDLQGRQLRGKGANLRVLKEGNRVDVTTFRNHGREIIREIHLVRGTLRDE